MNQLIKPKNRPITQHIHSRDPKNIVNRNSIFIVQTQPVPSDIHRIQKIIEKLVLKSRWKIGRDFALNQNFKFMLFFLFFKLPSFNPVENCDLGAKSFFVKSTGQANPSRVKTVPEFFTNFWTSVLKLLLSPFKFVVVVP